MAPGRFVVGLQLVISERTQPGGVGGVEGVIAGVGVGVAVPARAEDGGERIGGEETSSSGVVRTCPEPLQASDVQAAVAGQSDPGGQHTGQPGHRTQTSGTTNGSATRTRARDCRRADDGPGVGLVGGAGGPPARRDPGVLDTGDTTRQRKDLLTAEAGQGGDGGGGVPPQLRPINGSQLAEGVHPQLMPGGFHAVGRAVGNALQLAALTPRVLGPGPVRVDEPGAAAQAVMNILSP
ncbi:hypothetical protein SRABI128_05011 [Microbacterium sp. Bi128]|nr:hypothetical protein SRABI128_05011 [Microbacterium sp. Bi128]